MSKLNKLVTNYPVSLSEDEVANLSSTLLPVVEACGGGGGGGITQYYGDGTYTEITGSHVITLTNETKQKINRTIPTKVSDLTDSANYQTVEEMANYETTQHASQTYLTKSSADTLYAPLSTIADVEALKAASGDFSEYYKKNETYNKTEVYSKTETSSKETLSAEFDKYQTIAGMNDYVTNQQLADTITNLDNSIALKQNKLTFEYDSNNAISSIDGSALAGQGGKTYTPGQYIDITNDEISVTGVMALDEYAQYEPVLMGDANITATSSKVDNHTQWNLAINSTPVVTDTTLKGENVVTAHTTQVSGEWAVGLVQSAYEAIDSIDGISTDVTTLKTASGNWNKVSAKLDTTAFSTVSGSFLTAHQSLEDYATKSDINDMATQTWVSEQGYITQETDWTNTIQEASAKAYNDATANANSLYQAKGDYVKNTDIGLDSNNKVTAISGKELIITAHQSLTNYYTKSETSGATQLSTEFGKYLTTAQYNTDSATFALKTDLNGLVNSASVTTNDNYVMTNTGWKVLTLPGGGMTQVYHDTTLTGDGNANDKQLGVAWSALSGNTIASALSADVAMYYYDTVDNMPIGISTTINGIYNALDNYLLTGDIMPDNGISGNYISQAQQFELGLTQTAYNAVTSVSSKLDTTAAAQTYLTKIDYAADSATFLTGVVTGTGLSGTGLSNSPLGIDTGASIYFTNGSAKSAVSADKAVSASASKRLQDSTSGPVIQVGDVTALQNWASSNSSTWNDVTAKLGTAQYALDSATFVTSSNSTITGTKQYALTTAGWSSVETAYLPLTGGTVTGQMTLTGTGWENRLTIGRSNTAIDIGVASNGALTLKANINNACQFNMMQTGTSGVDINITYGQTPTAIGNLYVMKTHTIAEATTASGSWNGDNLLHIILDS